MLKLAAACAFLTALVISTPSTAQLSDSLRRLREQTREARDTVQVVEDIADDIDEIVPDKDPAKPAATPGEEATQIAQQCQASAATDSRFSGCAAMCKDVAGGITPTMAKETADAMLNLCKNAHATASAAAAPAVTAPVAQPSSAPSGAAASGAAAAKTAAPSGQASAAPVPKGGPPTSKALADAEKFAKDCASFPQYSDFYNCGCVRDRYLTSWAALRDQQLADWNNGLERDLLEGIARAKESGNPVLVTNAQRRYDETKAGLGEVPSDAVQLRFLGAKGDGRVCYSREAIVRSQTQSCLDQGQSTKTTPLGTPIDATYCGCVARAVAKGVIDDQYDGAQPADRLACDTSSPASQIIGGPKK